MLILISIHALLAESDPKLLKKETGPSNFYPRSPCGERPASSMIKTLSGDFYPRSPCGERPLDISTDPTFSRYFYPRSPCGERQIEEAIAFYPPVFLSTLSLRRATSRTENEGPSFCISIHALLAESDKDANDSSNANLHFYPRSPCGERPMGLDGRFKL